MISPKLVEVGRHLNIELLTYSEVQEVTGEPGNFKVKILQKPRYIDISKCTGCGDCGRVAADDNQTVTEAHGLQWVDRVQIDESKCIHCGDCVRACAEENPEQQGMTNIVKQRLQSVLITPETTPQQIASASLLQRLLQISDEERRSYWDEQFKKCIKCYGCVDVCPVYADRPDNFDLSKEIPQGVVPPPYPLFHFLRGYNVWDTCVVCGECEKTCPSGIPLKTFQDMIVFLPPEQVFASVPGLAEQDRRRILDFIAQRKGKINDAA